MTFSEMIIQTSVLNSFHKSQLNNCVNLSLGQALQSFEGLHISWQQTLAYTRNSLEPQAFMDMLYIYIYIYLFATQANETTVQKKFMVNGLQKAST